MDVDQPATSARSADSTTAKNINPQWTADSRSVYFISDRQGISNVYRDRCGRRRAPPGHQPADRRVRHHGDEPGAVGRRIARGVQRLRRRRLQHLRARQRRQRRALRSRPGYRVTPASSRRAPRPRARSIPTCVRRLPACRLWRKRQRIATEPYKPRLSVDFIGQPTVGVGVDSFGSYVGGGISAAFSDILGNHTVDRLAAGDEPARRGRRIDRLPESLPPLEFRRGARLDAVCAARIRARGWSRHRQRPDRAPRRKKSA